MIEIDGADWRQNNGNEQKKRLTWWLRDGLKVDGNNHCLALEAFLDYCCGRGEDWAVSLTNADK